MADIHTWDRPGEGGRTDGGACLRRPQPSPRGATPHAELRRRSTLSRRSEKLDEIEDTTIVMARVPEAVTLAHEALPSATTKSDPRTSPPTPAAVIGCLVHAPATALASALPPRLRDRRRHQHRRQQLLQNLFGWQEQALRGQLHRSEPNMQQGIRVRL